MKPCEKHADREGTLAVHLPSIGVKRYLCSECRADLTATLVKGIPARERQWSGWEMSPFGVHYISESAYHNPNSIYSRWKAER